MTQQLMKRRLVLGPIMLAVFVYAITAMSKDMGWHGAAVPSIIVGVLGSFFWAWYMVRSERPRAGRPAVHVSAGFIVAAVVTGTLLIRFGPAGLVFAVLVAGVAIFLGGTISSAYELRRGTYADSGTPADSGVAATG